MSPIAWALLPLKKFATFSGRARRREFWWFCLFNYVVAFIIGGVIGLAAAVTGAGEPGSAAEGVAGLWFLGTLIPQLAVAVRRLHDGGKSGWFMLIAFIPFVSLLLLVFYCQDSQPGKNKWGPNPKEIEGIIIPGVFIPQ